MKKRMLLMILGCLLLVGCSQAGNTPAAPEESETPVEAEKEEGGESEEAEEPAFILQPLPNITMDNLTDAILAVSLEEGDAYVDESGKMQMDLKIYSYDEYDMKDMAKLQIGDVIVRHSGEVKVESMERNASGTYYINGGVEAGGFDLVTGNGGVFYETGLNDVRNWYEVGEATIRVSADFLGIDSSDPEQGEREIYPGDFLVGAVTDYNFTPYNTTVRVEEGQIVYLERVYTP